MDDHFDDEDNDEDEDDEEDDAGGGGEFSIFVAAAMACGCAKREIAKMAKGRMNTIVDLSLGNFMVESPKTERVFNFCCGGCSMK